MRQKECLECQDDIIRVDDGGPDALIFADFCTYVCAARSLWKGNAQLEKDKQRLNWLEEGVEGPTRIFHIADKWWGSRESMTIRETIDSAMKSD